VTTPIPARYPFPIPFGWFCIGYPDDFPAGESRALYYFETHLAVWRDAAGDVHVQDAFCPHLGAHLGHGGTVEDGLLVCPFHGWKFDCEGTNVDIPYSERTNKKGRLRTYPAVEVNGLTFAWYHPDESVAPMWEVPSFPEFEGHDDDWSTLITFSHEIEAAPQELAENGVDSAHFRYVHNTAEVPVLDAYDTGFPVAAMRSTQKFPTPRGVMEGRIDSTSYGPGLSRISFSGIIDTLNLGCATPIDRNRSQLRFNFRFKTMGDLATTQGVGKAFTNEVNKQVLEDKVIWEHKAYLARPALADTDGPFTKFRKWYAQFYAEVPAGEERTVYAPPWWPERAGESPAKATASARWGG
jgi:nitrite reductase/ring-hydroxylating ferredoxin subunit